MQYLKWRVTLGHIAWSSYCCLTSVQTTSHRAEARFQGIMIHRNNPFGTHFGQRLEAKITGFQISLLLYSASVQDGKNLFGNIVRHIGDELKSAEEWADNEAIIPRVLCLVFSNRRQ